MKKLALFAIVAVSFASCAGNSSSEAAPAVDAAPIDAVVEEVEAVLVDSVTNDSLVVDEVAVDVAQ